MKPRKILTFFCFALSTLTGLVFLMSALTKLYPIEPFEFTFIDLGIAGWDTAPFMARFLIGLEFLCAAFLILNFNMRRVTIPLVSGLLLFFCCYLSWIMIRGNVGNCGCFGSFIPMTPLQALAKNIILLSACCFLYFAHSRFTYPRSRIIFFVLLTVSMALPFILNVVDLQTSQNLRPDKVNYQMPLDILYHSRNPQNKPPSVNLYQGKFILAYLSLTCPHCRIAAQKIGLLHSQDAGIPFFLVCNGDPHRYAGYLREYRLEGVPNALFSGPEEYIKMAGINLPEFFWINNGIVERKGNGYQLTPYHITDWLNKK